MFCSNKIALNVQQFLCHKSGVCILCHLKLLTFFCKHIFVFHGSNFYLNPSRPVLTAAVFHDPEESRSGRSTDGAVSLSLIICRGQAAFQSRKSAGKPGAGSSTEESWDLGLKDDVVNLDNRPSLVGRDRREFRARKMLDSFFLITDWQ